MKKINKIIATIFIILCIIGYLKLIKIYNENLFKNMPNNEQKQEYYNNLYNK